MENIVDKRGLLSKLVDLESVSLELGCGARKRDVDSIGIDILDYSSVDLVGDVFEVLKLFPDSCVNSVYAHHFIEHVDDINLLMSELSRVMKIDGAVEFIAPHFSNPYFYSDPTHRIFFGLYTFCYLSSGSPFSRQVPTYQKEFQFSLECVDLEFKSAKPFYFRYALKFLIGKIFNSSNYMKELYEENFCYLFPCYEVSYHLRRTDVASS